MGDFKRRAKMKNTLLDLNNHLFAQLERLNDEELTGENLKIETERAKAIADVAGKIIDNAALSIQAAKLIGSGNVLKEDLNPMLGYRDEKKI